MADLPPLPDDFPDTRAGGLPPLPDDFPRAGLPPLPDDFPTDDETPSSTSTGAFLRGAARSVVPSAAGIGTGLLVGGAIGGLPGAVVGLGAGALSGIGVSNLQQKLIESLPWAKGMKAQEQADIEQHPVASELGELAPGLAAGRPGGTLMQRLIGAAFGGVGGAATSYGQRGEVDWRQTAEGAAAGALLPNLSQSAERIAGAAGRFVRPERPVEADFGATQRALSKEDERLAQAWNQSVEDDRALARGELAKLGPGDEALAQGWRDYLARLDEVSAGGKGDPSVVQNASQGPGPEFTPQQADRANDLTTSAKGVAAENPKPPQDVGTGNPVGAPMRGRVGEPPTGPGRDYRKTSVTVGGNEGAESQAITQGAIKDDVAAALQNEQPQSTFEQQTVAPPQQAAAPVAQQAQGGWPKNVPKPDVEQIIQQGTWLARRRPIVRAPIPEGANASKNINGPIYVHPDATEPMAQIVKVHETVEELLRGLGYDYETAHGIATQAEKREAERLGVPWKPYEHDWDGLLSHSEQTARSPEVAAEQPPDKTISTEEALQQPEPGLGGKPVQTQVDETLTNARTRAATDPEFVQRVIDRARGLGWDDLISKLTEQPPEEQYRIASHPNVEQHFVAEEERQRNAAKAGHREVEIRPGVKVKTSGQPDADKITMTLDSIREALKKTGPLPDTSDNDAVQTHAIKFAAAAREIHGNKSPLETWKGGQKTAETSALHAAEKLTKPGTVKKAGKGVLARDYAAKYLTLIKGEGPLGQDVEADIAKKVRPSLETLSETKPQDRLGGHSEMEPFAGEGEAPRDVAAHNAMRDWWNNLDEPQQDILRADDPQIEQTIRTTQDPDATFAELKKTLEEGSREVPREEIKPPPQKAPKVTAPVTEIPQRQGYEPILDKKTGKFLGWRPKDFSQFTPQEAKREIPGAPITGSPVNGFVPPAKTRMQQLREQANAFLKAAGDVVRDEEGSVRLPNMAWPVSGVKPAEARGLSAVQPILQKFGDLWRDEGGSVRLPNFLKDNPFSFLSSSSPTVVKEAGRELRQGFNRLDGDLENANIRLREQLNAAPDKPGEFRQGLYRALQTGEKLNSEQQSYFDQVIKPLQDENNDLYDRWLARDPNLPPKFDGIEAKHVPRVLEDAFTREHNPDEPWKRTLSDWAAHLEDRKWYALTDGAGTRMLVEHKDDGEWAIVGPKGGNANTFEVPDGFKLGDEVILTQRGQDKTFRLDNAFTHEIIERVPNIKYVEDPIAAYMHSIMSQRAALYKAQTLDDIRELPAFQNNSTTDKRVADKMGWVPVQKLEEMKTENGKPGGRKLYMDRRLAWVLDDFAQPGYDMGTLGRLAGNLAKPLYFMSPTFHPLNVAAQYLIGAGPGGVPAAFQHGWTAWKSVLNQDALQHEIRAAGGRTMYPSVLMDGGLMRQIALKAGIELPDSRYMTKIFGDQGAKAADVLHAGMRKSNGLTWAANDMFLTMLYLKNKAAGMTPQQAINSAHRWIGSYRPDEPTLGMDNRVGRSIQQLLNTGAVSWFGPYHQDIWRAFGNTIRGLKPGADPQERKEALGAATMMGILAFGVYPYILDPAVQALTGNPDASLGRRGMLAPLQAAYEGFGQGDPAAQARFMGNIFTPSQPLSALMQQTSGRDWKGDLISPEGAGIGENLARRGQALAEQLVSPLGTALRATKPSNEAYDPVKAIVESAFGIKDPSEAARRWQANQEKRIRADTSKRERRPSDIMDQLITQAFR